MLVQGVDNNSEGVQHRNTFKFLHFSTIHWLPTHSTLAEDALDNHGPVNRRPNLARRYHPALKRDCVVLHIGSTVIFVNCVVRVGDSAIAAD